MNRKFSVAALAIGFLAFIPHAHADTACALSSSDVAHKIQVEGARKVLEWLYAENGTEITKLQICIASGQKDWLDIANALLKAAPQDADDEIPSAVSAALDNNPENVLAEPWIGSASFFCTDGADMYDNPYASYADAIDHANRRIAKIKKVNKAELRSAVKACVESLEENKKWIAHLYGKGS